ncbi:MAG: hypothetical protein PVG09_04890 [Thiohalocapsa sp.]
MSVRSSDQPPAARPPQLREECLSGPAALGPEVPPAPEHAALKLRLGDVGPPWTLRSRADALSRDQREQIGAQLAATALTDDAPWLQGLDACNDVARVLLEAAVSHGR